MDRLPTARERIAAIAKQSARAASETVDIPPRPEGPKAAPGTQLFVGAPQSVGTAEVVSVELDRVIDSPYQPRQRQLIKKDVEDLMRSIAAAGQTSPVILSPAAGENEGKLYVHSGHRRCAALRFLGVTTVRAIIYRDLDERAAEKLAVADNLGREDLTAYEQAVALKRYCETYGLTLEAGGAELGITRRNAFRLSAIAASSSSMLEAIRDLGIPVRAAELLSKIDGRIPRKALRLAHRYAAGAVTLVQLEHEAQKASAEERPGSVRAAKDILWKADARKLTLQVSLPVGRFTEGQTRRAVDAIAQLLGYLRVAEVKAAAVEVAPSVLAPDADDTGAVIAEGDRR